MNFLTLCVLCFFSFLQAHCHEGKKEIFQSSIDPNRKIEVYIRQSENETAPLLLFLHGASSELGWKSISPEWVDHWADKGYSVGAISLPGYGQSSGPKDFCGPITIGSLNHAIDLIKEELGISDFGQGSQAGLLLSAHRKDVRCIVASNAGYNLLRHLNSDDVLTATLILKNYALLIAEEDFKIRSPIEYVDRIEAPVFILHREENPVISTDEVEQFAQVMVSAGKECYVRILPKTKEADVQKLSYGEVLQATENWIDDKMRHQQR